MSTVTTAIIVFVFTATDNGKRSVGVQQFAAITTCLL